MTIQRRQEQRRQEIANLQSRLVQLQKEEHDEEVSSQIPQEERDLAEILHDKMCHANHTDGCGWGYESNWQHGVHNEYLTKARRLLRIAKFNKLKEIFDAMFQQEEWR